MEIKISLNDTCEHRLQSCRYTETSSKAYKVARIHDLIDEITEKIKTCLEKNFLLYPAFLKISLRVEGFVGAEPKKAKISVPRKKCYKIWDKEILAKTILKVHAQLLEFHSCMKSPFGWMIEKITGFKIKMRNMLTFSLLGDHFLKNIINEFDVKNQVQEPIFEEAKNQNIKNIRIFLLEKKESTFVNLVESNKDSLEYSLIGPFQFSIDDQNSNIKSDQFFDASTSNFMPFDEMKAKSCLIKTASCIFCLREMTFKDFSEFEENFKYHYSKCKERKISDTRDKKMKDDLINGVEVYEGAQKRFSKSRLEIFGCQHAHLNCFKLLRKPRVNYIKNEQKFEKLWDFDFEKSSEKTKSILCSTACSEISQKPKEHSKILKNLFPIPEWASCENQKAILRILNLSATDSLSDQLFSRFQRDVIAKVSKVSVRKPKIDELYNEFIHASPIFGFRNETFMRVKLDSPLDALVEYEAQDLLQYCTYFNTLDLNADFKFTWTKNGETSEKGEDKTVELKRRIERVAEEQKKLHFAKRYTYKLLKYQYECKDRNPYEFKGIIKCDLEYKKEADFIKKKIPVLPLNNWLEFRQPNNPNLRVPYKMSRSTFDDLNGYSILSDLLFYLLENDIVQIKRIEGYVDFTEKTCDGYKEFTSNRPYYDFFKPCQQEFLKFVDDPRNNVNCKLKTRMEKAYKAEVRSIFLQNLYRKETEDVKAQDLEGFYENFCQFRRILDFGPQDYVVSKPKSLEMKIFKIMAFVYMSYLNLMNIDAALGYLLNPKNINNIVLSNSLSKEINSNKMENGEKKREILVTKFSLLHISFERMIVKFTFKDLKSKKLKIDELLENYGKDGITVYGFRHILQDFIFQRPYTFFRNYREDSQTFPELAKKHPAFLTYNQSGFSEALETETTPINYCRYSTLNLPFKIHPNQLYFNKMIFDEGSSSKNEKTIELMLHNLENRYRSESASTEKSFKEVFNRKKSEFKEDIFNMLPKGMNLDGYGVKWNLDHVIPVNILKSEAHRFREVWSYSNVRPMKILENIQKGCQFGNDLTMSNSTQRSESINYTENVFASKNMNLLEEKIFRKHPDVKTFRDKAFESNLILQECESEEEQEELEENQGVFIGGNAQDAQEEFPKN